MRRCTRSWRKARDPAANKERGRRSRLKVTILNPKHVLYEGEARSVFLPGDLAEFELMDHHTPIVSLLRPGNVVVDWKTSIKIKRGMVKFSNNECMVLVEE
ncbi:MAG: hypothetical protein C0404_07500 [Verrucomicrobia bacterium]|nr:hypothetical protein [Verrucomicrobiota bacterium]